MQIGLHVSISGSIANAVTNAVERECSAFQIFTGNPRGWYSKELTKEDVAAYKKNLSESDIDRFATVAHMPYLPNLSTPDIPSYDKSIKAMIREVERCAKVGIPYLVTHLGSHKGDGEERGIQRLTNALAEIFFSLEPADRFGICIDTCHAFAAGYDLKNQKNVKDTFEKFDKEIGLKHLKILHLNDSKGELGSHLDRHDHIGLGQIGNAGLSKVIKLMNKNKIPIILETPIDDRRDEFGDIGTAKELA